MPHRTTPFRMNNYYHIFCRGNEQRTIFICQEDYQRFVDKMQEYQSEFAISIICYCLMPNHYHFILKQTSEESVSDYMQKLMVSYVMYFNKRYRRVGYLFENRFRAKLIEDEHYLLHLSRYIHYNPYKIVTSLRLVEHYPWSSYAEFLERGQGLCDKEVILEYFDQEIQGMSYRQFVSELGERLIHSETGS